MRSELLAVTAAGMLSVAEMAQPEAAKEGAKLWAAISVSHPVYVPGEGGDPFVMHFALINDGDKVVRSGHWLHAAARQREGTQGLALHRQPGDSRQSV